MYEEINQELAKSYEGMQLYNKKVKMLDDLKKQLKEYQEKESNYRKELEKEEKDLEKYSKKSLTTIFYTILGSKEEQENKERQEALAAHLKLEEALKQLDEIKSNITKLVEEKDTLRSCESHYKNLYQKKYDLLKSSGNAEAEKILKLEESISCSKGNLREIDEAISSGQCVLNRVSDAVTSLSSAKNWGTWDMWGGGGLLTDLVKHSHIDAARDAASDIQRLLNNFRTELADVKLQANINIAITGFDKFADFFFDGLIADWVVQSQIKTSLESVSNMKQEVEGVINKLKIMKSAEDNYIKSFNNELNTTVESAK
jgi:hypothetical protein